MRLMFVAPAYRPSFFEGAKGGGEISNQILLEAMARRATKTYIISMLPVINETVYRDGRLVVIEPFASFKGKGLFIIVYLCFFKSVLTRLLERIKPDVALSTTSVVKATSEACRVKGVRNGGVVRAMENMPGYGWECNPRSLASLIKFLIHKATIGWPGGRELDGVDFIVANSEFLKAKYLSEFPGKPACVIYPALAISKSTIPLTNTIRRVMMVGTSHAKGFDIFKQLASAFPLLEFHAIGDRSLAKGETRREGEVVVHGWMSNPIPFIDEMDLVLVPSRWEEPFGRISVEAMYRNKFVLVSDMGGLPETVGNTEEYIVRSHDPDDWKNKIDYLIREIQKYKRMHVDVQGRVFDFDLKTQVRYFDKFLREIC